MKKTYAPILTLLISALGVLPPAAAALAQGEMALAPAAQHLQEKNLLLVVAIVDGILLLSTVALALILGIRRRRHRLDRVLARRGRAYAPEMCIRDRRDPHGGALHPYGQYRGVYLPGPDRGYFAFCPALELAGNTF